MRVQKLVESWFDKWEAGDFYNLPIAENFRHTSPFGTIDGKEGYLKLVEANRDKFLGYSFQIHDRLFGKENACVRYTALQGDFRLDVSE